jgi:hypothetical protein
MHIAITNDNAMDIAHASAMFFHSTTTVASDGPGGCAGPDGPGGCAGPDGPDGPDGPGGCAGPDGPGGCAGPDVWYVACLAEQDENVGGRLQEEGPVSPHTQPGSPCVHATRPQDDAASWLSVPQPVVSMVVPARDVFAVPVTDLATIAMRHLMHESHACRSTPVGRRYALDWQGANQHGMGAL